MDKKLRQVTDNIHGTIYLSNLESELISTPYFYRLHDVYQSSTVYMTYPSNRTKRYEHSLGTMELAGAMLYSSVLNADSETKAVLFEKLNAYFKEIFSHDFHYFANVETEFYIANKEDLETLLDEYSQNLTEESVNNTISTAIKEGCFADSALDYFQYYPMQNDIGHNQNINFFLYRCLLQSVRIIALFHDVGHPPYSHIIEDVLDEIYKKYSNSQENNVKVKCLKECFRNYAGDEKVDMTHSRKDSLQGKPPALHERIGLSFLDSAINDTVSAFLKDILNSDTSVHCKIASLIYSILVVRFSLSVVEEKDVFFKSFHKIVDGILDADRLDYITRDSLNSGVDWGKIPYKRLIKAAKLVYLCKNEEQDKQSGEYSFVVSFPQKEMGDIAELLLTRYKIFERINFHHRCMKTAAALKDSVKILAEDYLCSTNDADCINANIKLLWTSLGNEAGDRKKRVITWNDSWLISTLYQSLANWNGEKTNRESVALKENLEEILLNKKRHYSLIKRADDNKKFVEKIYEYLNLNKDKLNELLESENQRFRNDSDEENDCLSSPQSNALDSLNRIAALGNKDIESLDKIITTKDYGVEKIVENTLQQLQDNGEFLDFSIIVNKYKDKDGLPKHTNRFDEIYLYNDDGIIEFDTRFLKEQIDVIRKNIPWLYIYIVPSKHIRSHKGMVEMVLDTLSKEIAEKARCRLKELFPGSQICT